MLRILLISALTLAVTAPAFAEDFVVNFPGVSPIGNATDLVIEQHRVVRRITLKEACTNIAPGEIGAEFTPALSLLANANEAPSDYSYGGTCFDNLDRRVLIFYVKTEDISNELVLEITRRSGQAFITLDGRRVATNVHVDVYNLNTQRRVDVFRIDIGKCEPINGDVANCPGPGKTRIALKKGSLTQLDGFVTIPTL